MAKLRVSFLKVNKSKSYLRLYNLLTVIFCKIFFMLPIKKQVYRHIFQWQDKQKHNVVPQHEKLLALGKETQPKEEQLQRNVLDPEGEEDDKLLPFFILTNS